MHFGYLTLTMKSKAVSSRRSLFALLLVTMAIVVGGASVISEPRSAAMASVELVNGVEEMVEKEVDGVKKGFAAMVVELVGKGHEDGAIGTTPMMDNHPPDSVPAGSDPHQDDALDADRGAGELTVKSSLRQGLYCRHDNQCGSGQMCDAVSANYRCVHKFNNGRSCNQDSLCSSGHCRGVCVACTSNSHCGSGQYCTGTYRCEDKGSINDYRDPTHLSNGYLHAPCGEGLRCSSAPSANSVPSVKSLPQNDYKYAVSGETCESVSRNECAAAGNALTGWSKVSSEVVVGYWSWAPCGCYIRTGTKIQFNTHDCNTISLNDRGRHDRRAICKVSSIPVSCGNHVASSCAECPQGHGSAWCNGVCTWDNNLNGCVANTCGPLFSGRRCSDVGNNKYCNADTGECGSSDLHQFAQLGNEFDSPDIVDAGRCGPLFGGRVCNCNRFEVYCNTVNGWCGSGDAHKNAQVGEEYDCPYFKSCSVDRFDYLGDGYCNGGDYNTAACGWDGGDCCESTCVDSCQFKCTQTFNCKSLELSLTNSQHKLADTIINAGSADLEMSIWVMSFFEHWGYFPIEGLNEAMEHIKEQMESTAMWDDAKDKAEEVVNSATSHAIDRGLNLMVAREVVKATVKGGRDVLGRRMAIVVVQRSATLAASQAAKVAFMTIGSLGVGLSSAVGEIATELVLEAFGINNPTAITYGGAAGSIVTGIIAGTVIGGPIGAAVGGTVGAASWLVGQGVSALFRTGKGPNDNWCYIVKANSVDDVMLYTYEAGDGLRLFSYWSEDTADHDEERFVMSAGQPSDESFQMDVGDAYFQNVYFQDTMFIGRNTCGTNRVCHCAGSFNQEMTGQCDCRNY